MEELSVSPTLFLVTNLDIMNLRFYIYKYRMI